MAAVTPGIRWTVWLLFAAAWTTALLMPVPVKPDTGLGSPAVLYGFSKAVHLSAYALFAILTAWLPVRGTARWLLLAFLPVHAAGTEFLQWLLPMGRTGCVVDVGLDVLGIGMGMGLNWMWRQQREATSDR